MKIGLFLAVVEERDQDWSVGPPLGLGYLSSYLKTYGEGLDTVIRRKLDDLIAEKPDLVGISCTTYSYNVAIRAAQRIKKELGIPCIIGGTHITAMPERLHPVFDAGVMNEGEQTLLEICQALKANGKLEPQSLTKINGIIFHGGTEIVFTPPRNIIEDLDKIPPPDRKEIGSQWGEIKKHAHIMTSRGCPYHCTFCSTVRHWGRTHRFFSPGYVVQEIESLVREWDAQHIIIFDDLFISHKARLVEIRSELQRKGILERVHFTVSARANQIKEDNVEAIRQMNIHDLTMGFESASANVLEYLGKDGVTPQILQRCIDLCHNSGLSVAPSFIIGSPNETRDDLKQTFDFILDNIDVLSAVVLGPLMVLPATPVWNYATKRGLIDDNLSGIVLEPEDLEDDKRFFFEKYVYLNEHISREEFWMHYQMAKRLEKMVWKNHDQQCRLNNAHSEESLLKVSGKRLMKVLGRKIRKKILE